MKETIQKILAVIALFEAMGQGNMKLSALIELASSGALSALLGGEELNRQTVLAGVLVSRLVSPEYTLADLKLLLTSPEAVELIALNSSAATEP